MAKYCPEKQNYALYLDCKECEERTCEKPQAPQMFYFLIQSRKKWIVHSISRDKAYLEKIKESFDESIRQIHLNNGSKIVSRSEIENIHAPGWEEDVLLLVE